MAWGLLLPTSSAQDVWPPARPLEPVATNDAAGTLPASVSTEPATQGAWRCTFSFRPRAEAKKIALVGTFNGWDRQANLMTGPDAAGTWQARVALNTGVYEYKFLVNDEQWLDDPLGAERWADGFGGYNSVLRIGQLARMTASSAQLGDGEIDPVGIEHQPSLPLYTQPLGGERVLIRHRTLAHDVAYVQLAVRGGELTNMRIVAQGSLFTYREAQIAIPKRENPRSPGVRSVEYTFVLTDGPKTVGDPYTYRYTFTNATLFEAPEWAKHAVWYQIMLDRFRNGNAANDPDPVRPWTSAWFSPAPWEGADGQKFYEHYVFQRSYGGDLAGLEQMLPYLKDLGINALYLNPVFKATSYHKYDTQNYLHVDDHFGTKGDYDVAAAREDLRDPSTWQWTETDQRFIAFLKKAHELGFKVIVDGVFNHVGSAHVAFQDVVSRGQDSPYADWFQVLSWEPFAYNSWAGFPDLPVFKKTRQGFASDALRQHLFAVTRRWMDPNGDGDPRDGVDGWRLDVPNDVPLGFWAEWRKLVKEINPDAFITGEVWHRADKWLDGHHFDAVMNYQFAKTAVKWILDRERKITATDAVGRLAELRLAYPAAATYALQNLVDSHDTDRLASMALNPDREYDRENRAQDNNPNYDNSKPPAAAYARARLVALLQMTYIGAPMIYYGDEVGMWGADDPTCRKPMLWEDLQPYEMPEENFVMKDHLAFYKQAIALRNAHPVLRTGSFEWLLAHDAADVWAFVRADENEQLVVVLNAADRPRQMQIQLPVGAPQEWEVVFGGEGSIQTTDGAIPAQIDAISGVVFHTKLR